MKRVIKTIEISVTIICSHSVPLLLSKKREREREREGERKRRSITTPSVAILSLTKECLEKP